MKNDIQKALQERWKGLSDAEVREQRRQELETSQSPIAKWWRSINRPRADKVET